MDPEGMESSSGPYPERLGEPDCVYYMRTGLCGFGVSCRFNHPSNREPAAIVAQSREEYPERFSEPECQYYLRTGTYKFGTTCKFHHPRDKAGVLGRVQFNILGLPFRSGGTECAYYMWTGFCKYGATCKYHHPQPTAALMPMPMPVLMPSSSLYALAGSPSEPNPQSYPAAIFRRPLASAPYLPGSHLQVPISLTPRIIPRTIMPVAGWGPCQVQQPPSVALGYFCGGAHQVESSGVVAQGAFSPCTISTGGVGVFSPQSQSIARGLSPMGLPLRTGVPPCRYYTHHGVCTFGPTCRFDHPIASLSLIPSGASVADSIDVVSHVSSADSC